MAEKKVDFLQVPTPGGLAPLKPPQVNLTPTGSATGTNFSSNTSKAFLSNLKLHKKNY